MGNSELLRVNVMKLDTTITTTQAWIWAKGFYLYSLKDLVGVKKWNLTVLGTSYRLLGIHPAVTEFLQPEISALALSWVMQIFSRLFHIYLIVVWYSCLHVGCIHVHVYICMYTCAYMWKPEIDMKNLP